MFQQTNEGNGAPKFKEMYVFMRWVLCRTFYSGQLGHNDCSVSSAFLGRNFQFKHSSFSDGPGDVAFVEDTLLHSLYRMWVQRNRRVLYHARSRNFVFNWMNSLIKGRLIVRPRKILAVVVPNIFSIDRKFSDSVRVRNPTLVSRFSGAVADKNVDGASNSIRYYYKFDNFRS
jgi:hypothetical protein